MHISAHIRLWVMALGYSGFTFEVPTSTSYRFAIKELKMIIRAFKLDATVFLIIFFLQKKNYLMSHELNDNHKLSLIPRVYFLPYYALYKPRRGDIIPNH